MGSKTSAKELNAFLKGECMAIDSYEKYINTVQDSSTKNDMSQILKVHRDNAQELSDRIVQLGGKPTNSIGLRGKFGQMMGTIKDIKKHSDEDICKKAYYWENKGSNMAEEIVKGDIDSESADLVNKIISADKDNLNTLKKHFNINEFK